MNKKSVIKFNIIAIISIIILCIALTPVTLQNDTFYTIKLGGHIVQNGMTEIDSYTWHEDVPYTYPHWAYDVLIYLIYSAGGYLRNIYSNSGSFLHSGNINLFSKF